METSGLTSTNLKKEFMDKVSESPAFFLSLDKPMYTAEQLQTIALIQTGKLPIQRMKLILLGQSKAGKTSLLRALRGESFSNRLDRTNYMDFLEVDHHDFDNWVEMKDVSQISRSVNIAKRKQTQHAVGESKFDTVDPDYVKLVDEIHSSPVDGDIVTLSVYDFAGQDIYSSLQQIFVTSDALYLLVFSLKKIFPNERSLPDPEEVQVILSWLATIHLRAPYAKILLIGTQMDQTLFEKRPLPKTCSEQLDELFNRLPGSILGNLVVLENQVNEFILLTSSKSGTCIPELKSVIDRGVRSSFTMMEDRPIGWIRFQDELTNLIKEGKCPVVYAIEELFDDVIRGTEKFGIESIEDLKTVLMYFHTIGVVLYFPGNEELREFVFPDTQKLVNVLCNMFKRCKDPPSFSRWNPSSLQLIRSIKSGLVRKGYWAKSLLGEVLSQLSVGERQHSLFLSLLKEFDLYCEIKLNEVVDVILPCLLPSDNIGTDLPKSHRTRSDYESIDLIINFPDSTLPKGLFHQLSIRFASNSPTGYLPILNNCSSLISLGDSRQMIMIEEQVFGVIRVLLFVVPDIRTEFNYSWIIINSTIQLALSEHWSRRSTSLNYNLAIRCLGNTQRKHGEVPHKIPKIPPINSQFPTHSIHCDHFSHGNSPVAVTMQPLRKYWFKDESTKPDSPLPRKTANVEDDLKKMIMLSYCWGKKDEMTNMYPDQERVKDLALKLESRGFNVWLDIYFMSGNMISTMTGVIENCAAVIACVTNDYHVENSNGYDEFVYACAKKRDRVVGVKLTYDADMMGGAYGLKKGFKDLFYDLSTEDTQMEMDKLECYLRGLLE
ncbi:hypothetical protein HK098_001227 [Nowakowskiella sp. JEL0407]|nr:hypothetical protein HK098_001227 [Nowakowskiella sp. JEL0407]